MGISVDEIFPENCEELRKILKISIEFAINQNHCDVKLEHIVWSYFKYIETTSKPNYKIFPWYTTPTDYFDSANFASFEVRKDANTLNLEYDVYLLSEECKKYEKDINLESFYYLMINMQLSKKFQHRHCIPISPKINQVLLLGDFEIFLKSDYSKVYIKTIMDSTPLDTSKKDVWETFQNGYNNILSTSKSSKKPIYSKAFSQPINMDGVTDITYYAYQNNYSNIVTREYETNRIIDILSKKRRNNVVLLGEAGVGKTTIVQALANRIVRGNIPNVLKDYHILELHLVSAIAGTQYRGEFEKRIKSLIDSILYSNFNTILYIKSIHSCNELGSSDRGESLSLGEMLEPLLQNSKVKVIGTSDFKSYRELEKNKSLASKFDTIIVDEPNNAETLEILQKTKTEFEDFYKIKIPDEVLKSVIKLSNQYIPERHQPDKCIDVLDESCAILKNSYKVSSELSIDDVLTCISRKKNIPLDTIKNANSLTNMEHFLNSKIIGQQEVICKISKTIRRVQAGFNNENKPIASFMFTGPTGVGKTEIAKTLANLMYSSKDSFIRFDMSEYMEEHTVSKLIGSPPGYIGYKESGQLTEQVRHHPYSLILFDEFEKAHPKIYNLLLQILDDGILTDNQGNHINFKNTIIILTSNVGANELSKNVTGFTNSDKTKGKNIMSEIKKKFSPEFLNRLDEILQFNSLTKSDILTITKNLIFTDVISKLNSKNIEVGEISDTIVNKIVEQGYSVEYGARELKRTISRMLIDPLTDYLLENSDAQDIVFEMTDDNITISSKNIAIKA